MIKSNNGSVPPGGISEKMKTTLSSLLDSSQLMKQAIIRKDVNTVWEIIAYQEEKVSQLEQYNYLWKHLTADGEINSPEINKAKEEINEGMRKLKEQGRSNSSLIRSFLGAISKVFQTTGTKLAPKPNVYGRKGKMSVKKSSLLVNRVG